MNFLSRAKNTSVNQFNDKRVVTYLKLFSKTKTLEGWQINQSIDAIHIFLRNILHKGLIDDIDWQSYKHDIAYTPRH